MANIPLGRQIVDSLLLRTATLEPFIEAGLDLNWATDPLDTSRYEIFDSTSLDHYQSILRYHAKYANIITVEQFQRSYPLEVYKIHAHDRTPFELVDLATNAMRKGQRDSALREAIYQLQEGGDPDSALRAIEAAHAVNRGEPIRMGEREAIENRKRELRVNQQAKLELAMEANEDEDVIGSNMMSEPEDADFLVRDLFPEDGYLMITAQRKRGKTTILGNLIASLVDAGHFLDEFKASGYSRVFLIDTEMPENQHKRWLKSWGIFNHPRLFVAHHNGRAGAVARMLFDPQRRENFVEHLKANRIDVLVVDPLGPILRALGMDENSADIGRAVDAIKEIVAEAGVRNLVIVHHQGKDAGRGARGHSVLEGTPDVVWELDGKGDIGSDKLRAWGRDVNKTVGLYFDPDTKTYSAYLNEGDEDTITNDDKVLAVIRNNPGLSGNRIYALVEGMNKTDCTDAIRALEVTGKITNDGTESRPMWKAA